MPFRVILANNFSEADRLLGQGTHDIAAILREQGSHLVCGNQETAYDACAKVRGEQLGLTMQKHPIVSCRYQGLELTKALAKD